MQQQIMAFDVLPHDTHVNQQAEVRRLTGQNATILAWLKHGPVTARELAAISLNYRARISDLRAAGYSIPPPVEDRTTGVSVYRLEAK